MLNRLICLLIGLPAPLQEVSPSSLGPTPLSVPLVAGGSILDYFALSGLEFLKHKELVLEQMAMLTSQEGGED